MKTVAINGYGTIGKRVADAVAAQDDMKVLDQTTKQEPLLKKKVILYTLEFQKENNYSKMPELK